LLVAQLENRELMKSGPFDTPVFHAEIKQLMQSDDLPQISIAAHIGNRNESDQAAVRAQETCFPALRWRTLLAEPFRRGGIVANPLALTTLFSRLFAAYQGNDTAPLTPATVRLMVDPSEGTSIPGTDSWWGLGWQVFAAPNTTNQPGDWEKNGGLPGTSSLLFQSADGTTWAYILNENDGDAVGAADQPFEHQMKAYIQAAIAAWTGRSFTRSRIVWFGVQKAPTRAAKHHVGATPETRGISGDSLFLMVGNQLPHPCPSKGCSNNTALNFALQG
jgi:hypothetical protein